jgi:hypothetical protein
VKIEVEKKKLVPVSDSAGRDYDAKKKRATS